MPNRPARFRIEDLPAPALPVGIGVNDSSDDSSSDPSDELSQHSDGESSQHSSDELDLASSDKSISSSNDVFCEGFISLSTEPRINIKIRELTPSTTVDSGSSDQDPEDMLMDKDHNNENDGRHLQLLNLEPESEPSTSNVEINSVDKVSFVKADRTNPNERIPQRNKHQHEVIIYDRERYRMTESTRRTTNLNEEQEDDRSRVADITSYGGRLQTFFDWHNHSIDITNLARAGFYYTGSGDSVRCFLCGGGLYRWEEGADLWDEHYKAFGKHCLHK